MLPEPMGNRDSGKSKHSPDARYQSFLITEEQKAALEALAERNHRSVSAEIRLAIEARLAEQGNPEPEGAAA